VIQDAVARDRKLRVRYAKARQRADDEVAVDADTVERVVDPLGLVAKGNTWYLVANGATGFRTYRVSRIQAATVLDLAVKRPANFDLEKYWKHSTEQFKQSWPRFDATLRLRPGVAREMKMWRTASAVDDPDPSGALESGEWTTLRVQFDDEEQARFMVLGMGSRAQVVAPGSLRDAIRTELATMTKFQDVTLVTGEQLAK
jgi:predicted DNA-binding transcriptional regulator YafY